MDITGGRVIYYLGGSLAKLEKALKDGGKKVKDFGGTIKENSKEIGIAFGAAGTAITGALGLAVSSSNKFKAALAEVSTLGVKDMATLEAGIQSIARTYGKDLTETAKGAYQVISATGLEAADANKVLALATEAATAGVSNVSAAVELGTGVMNAFGKGVDDLSGIYDQAFLAVKNGVTTFDELSASVGKLSPIFSAAGLTSEEMFASITALTKAGINTSEAVTGMKAAISNIVKPTKDALDTAKELGIQFDVSALKTKGLSTFMQELKDKTGGNVESMASLFGSTEALNSVLALTGAQNASFNETLTESSEKAGQMKEALKKIIDNDPNFVWKQNKANMEVISNFIGTALNPALNSLGGFLKSATDKLIDMRDESPRLFNAITTLLGGAGVGAVGLGGFLVVLPQIVTSVGHVAKAFSLLRPVLMSFNTVPVIAALTGIAWALKELYDNWDWMWPEMKRTYADFSRWVESWHEKITGFLGGMFRQILDSWKIGVDAMFEYVESAFNGFTEFIGGWVKSVEDAFGNLKSKASSSITGFKDSVVGGLSSTWGYMKEFGGYIHETIGNSTWIDAFENLSTKAGIHFGYFDKTVKGVLAGITASMLAFTPALATTVGRVEGGGRIVLQSGEVFELGAERIAKGGSIILQGGKEAKLGADEIERGGKIISSTGEVYNVAAAKIGDTTRNISPALKELLKNIESNSLAMQAGIGPTGSYGSALDSLSTSAKQAAAAIAQVGDKIIGPGGWQQIKTDAESLFSGKLGGTTRAVTGSIQIEGTTLAGILTGAADQVKFSLSQILEASGQTFSDLYRDFMKYFHSQIELWQHGSEQVVLSVEEWANQIVQNSVGLQRALTSNFDTLAGAIDLTSDTIVESLKRVTSAIAETSRVTRTFSDPTGTGTRGFAAGGVTPHPIVKVGERGPELAALPIGTRIMSHSDMMSAVKGFASGGVVTVDAALRQLQSRLNNPGNLYVQGIGNTGSILTEIALNNYLWRYNQTHPVTSGAQDTGQRGYAEAMIQRNERIRQARIQDTSARASGSLSTGFSGIDAGLANRGTSGATINIHGPLIEVKSVNASDQRDIDNLGEKVLRVLDKEIFGKLSAKGLSLNVGYTG